MDHVLWVVLFGSWGVGGLWRPVNPVNDCARGCVGPQSLLGFKWNGNDVLQCRVFDTDSLSAEAAHGTAFVR